MTEKLSFLAELVETSDSTEFLYQRLLGAQMGFRYNSDLGELPEDVIIKEVESAKEQERTDLLNPLSESLDRIFKVHIGKELIRLWESGEEPSMEWIEFLSRFTTIVKEVFPEEFADNLLVVAAVAQAEQVSSRAWELVFNEISRIAASGREQHLIYPSLLLNQLTDPSRVIEVGEIVADNDPRWFLSEALSLYTKTLLEKSGGEASEAVVAWGRGIRVALESSTERGLSSEELDSLKDVVSRYSGSAIGNDVLEALLRAMSVSGCNGEHLVSVESAYWENEELPRIQSSRFSRQWQLIEKRASAELGEGLKRAGRTKLKAIAVNRLPFTEQALLELYGLIAQQTLNVSLEFIDAGWGAVADALRYGEVDIGVHNLNIRNQLRQGETQDIGKFGPIFSYRGYEVVVNKNYLRRVIQQTESGSSASHDLELCYHGEPLEEDNAAPLSSVLDKARIGVPSRTDIETNLQEFVRGLEHDVSDEISPMWRDRDPESAVTGLLDGRLDVICAGANDATYLTTMFSERASLLVNLDSAKTDVFMFANSDFLTNNRHLALTLFKLWNQCVPLWEEAVDTLTMQKTVSDEAAQFHSHLFEFLVIKLNRNIRGGFVPTSDSLVRIIGEHDNLFRVRRKTTVEQAKTEEDPGFIDVVEEGL